MHWGGRGAASCLFLQTGRRQIEIIKSTQVNDLLLSLFPRALEAFSRIWPLFFKLSQKVFNSSVQCCSLFLATWTCGSATSVRASREVWPGPSPKSAGDQRSRLISQCMWVAQSEGSHGQSWRRIPAGMFSLGCFHCGLGSERIWKNEIFNFLSTWPNTTKRLLKISSFYSKKKSWKCCLFTKLTNTNQVISLTDLWDSLCTACFYRFILLLSKKAERKVFVIDSVLWAL